MKNQLTESNYQKLISEISQIYESARQKALAAADYIFTLARWEIGRKLIDEEQRGNLRADYGDGTIKRASRDLTQRFGRGFSVTNLKYMKQFYISYQIGQPADLLSWTLYCILLTIKDDNKRALYEKKIRKLGWSKRELIQQIRKDKVELIKLTLNSLPRRQAGNAGLANAGLESRVKLSFTRGLLYTYKLIQAQGKDSLLVDCGFNFHKDISIRYSQNPKEGNIVESVQTENGFYAKQSERTKNDLYTYKAFVQELVDADTYWCEVDLGFTDSTLQKMRLRGIDCPEIGTPKGKEALEFVKARLKDCKFIVVRTFYDKSDKYDRYLIDVFYLPNQEDAGIVASQGIFLNQELLDNGLAKIWEE